MRPELLQNVTIVLDHPQNVVNIAGVVRAMKNMGLSRLRLVNPDEFDPWRIEGIAHRSSDVVESAGLFESLEEAVSDCAYVLGTTARPRTAHRNYHGPRESARVLVDRARAGRVAVVLGREDRGLTNEALDRCDGVIVIPTNSEYSSMNLAHACLLIAYEIFLAAGEEEPVLPQGKRSTGLATRGEIESMIRALEDGLERIEFFKARAAESVMRTFRTLLSRAEPDRQEAGLVKALGFEIGNYLDRLDSRGTGEEDQDRESAEREQP